jgi:hypothetical protein
MASSSACLAPNSRIIMSGFPGYPHSNQITQAEAESFANQLFMAGWPLDQTVRADYAAQPGSPRSKQLVGTSRSDVQLRRDIGSSSGAGLSASHIAELQLQHQHLGGSSGPGSDTGGSGQHQSYQDEVKTPAKRGRGRQRKNTGVETAQQVSGGLVRAICGNAGCFQWRIPMLLLSRSHCRAACIHAHCLTHTVSPPSPWCCCCLSVTSSGLQRAHRRFYERKKQRVSPLTDLDELSVAFSGRACI